MTVQVTRLTTLGVPFTIPNRPIKVFLEATGIPTFYVGTTPVTQIYLGTTKIK
jgi:hypothetical protein